MTLIKRIISDDDTIGGAPVPSVVRQHIDPGHAKCIVCGCVDPSDRPGWDVCDCCKKSICTVELGAPLTFAEKDSQIVAVDFNPRIGLG